MQIKDYRLTEHSPEFEIRKRKDELNEVILREHPRKRNMYDAVQAEYKPQFGAVYNRRCAYCGVPMGVLSYADFEIDHILCRAKAKMSEGSADVDNNLENLAFACRTCNRRKSDYWIGGESYRFLNPDENLGTTFIRDVDYRIRISSESEGVSDIECFYQQMAFSGEMRRLDYLLAGIHDLSESLKDGHSFGLSPSKEIRRELDAAFGALVSKRNFMQNK